MWTPLSLVSLCLAAWLAFPSDLLAQSADEESAAIVTAPVIVDGVELFRVRGISALPADRRAAAIADRIRTAASDETIAPDAVRLVEREGRTEIVAGSAALIGVFDVDARNEDIDRGTLAEAYRLRIQAAIEGYRRDRSPDRFSRAVGYALAATFGFGLGLVLLFRLERFSESALEHRYKQRVRSVAIRELHILEADQVWRGLRGLLRLILTVLLIVLAWVWASNVLALFPSTRLLSNQLLGYILQPLTTLTTGFISYVPNLLFLAVLVILARYLLGLLRLIFAAIERGTLVFEGFDREWAWPTHRIFRVLLVAFLLVVAYPYIPGSGSAAFQGISIFLGVLFSLGSSTVVSNIIAGYSLFYRRSFKIGDRVKIGETIGDVTAMRLEVTHLRTPFNEEITVPNSVIIGSQVINYSSQARQGRLILRTTVGIGYETPWRQVEGMLLLAAERTQGVKREPPPFVRQMSLGDFAITYAICFFCDDAQQMYALYTELHRNILDVFNEYGVQIMTPAYEGDPPEPKVVPKDRWHEAPARP
jgi:small-conductance mechanosensitive channel